MATVTLVGISAIRKTHFRMKVMVGVGICIIGIIVWAVSLFAALGIVNTTIVSLGVIAGGTMIMSGIALICLSGHPRRVPYFDKGP